MKEISVTRSGLSTMCRLCLSSGVRLLDIFCFSSEMENSVASVIMKCASVQITRGDEMPNFICQSCCTQLEKTHQFLIQIEESDKTLRRYLQLLYTSDKPIKVESSVEPSQDPLILDANKDIAKCESLERNDMFDMDLNWKETEHANFIQDNQDNKEMCVKSEIKVEVNDDCLFLPTEYTVGTEDIRSYIDGKEFNCEDSKTEVGEAKVSEGMPVNLKKKEPEKCIVTNKLMEEIYLKSEINDEQMDDNLLILTESVDETKSASYNGDGNEISYEDTDINIGHASENLCPRSTNKKANTLKSYQCDICNKRFATHRGLYYHKPVHTGEKPYRCDLCDKCFSRSFILNRHKLKHTVEKPYQCDLCKKCFSELGNFSQHKLIHTGEKPYQCDLCNKCFTQLPKLNRHKHTHTDAKLYHCDLCNSCFSQSSHLNKHRLIHTGEKPYQCDFCKKCFSELGNLNHHKRVHTGEKPYQCDLCNKCFAQSSNLNKHKRIHTGEKPYQCDLCNKRFVRSSNLNKHKRMHTGEKPYQCDLCNKRFVRSSTLYKHKRTHTDEKL